MENLSGSRSLCAVPATPTSTPEASCSPPRLLKVKCGSIMMSRSTTEKEFRRLQWECIYKAYNLHAWKEAPLTDAELASGSKNVTPKQLRASISRLADEKDKGIDPVYHLTFVFKKGERLRTETEPAVVHDEANA